jgi:hypothetical protein
MHTTYRKVCGEITLECTGENELKMHGSEGNNHNHTEQMHTVSNLETKIGSKGVNLGICAKHTFFIQYIYIIRIRLKPIGFN